MIHFGNWVRGRGFWCWLVRTRRKKKKCFSAGENGTGGIRVLLLLLYGGFNGSAPPPPPPPPPQLDPSSNAAFFGNAIVVGRIRPKKNRWFFVVSPRRGDFRTFRTLLFYYNPKRFPLEKRSPLFFWDMPDVSSDVDVGSICHSLPLPSDLDGNWECEIDTPGSRSGEPIHTKNLTITMFFPYCLKVVSSMT